MRLVTFAASGAQRIGALRRRRPQNRGFRSGARRRRFRLLKYAGADRSRPRRRLIAPVKSSLTRKRSGRGVIDAASVKLLVAAADAAADARFPLLREAFDSGLWPLAPGARRRRARSGKGAARDWRQQGIFQCRKIWYERPSFYKPSRLASAGPIRTWSGRPIRRRSTTSWNSPVSIGTSGRDIPKDKARAHIFGYTIFNDLSARDEQSSGNARAVSGRAKAKISTTRIRSAPASSPRTKSPTPTR